MSTPFSAPLTVVVLCRLFPNFAGESLLHFTEEQPWVRSCTSPVDIGVFGRVPLPRGRKNEVDTTQGGHR